MEALNLPDDLDAVETTLTQHVRPDSLSGALFYLVLFLIIGTIADLMVRRMIHAARSRDAKHRLDPTALGFLQGLSSAGIWVMVLVAYAHLIPALRNLGTALLAGASVISIVMGLAAQNTLGNLVAGFSLLLYRPFRVGDRLQVTAPTGVESGTVESLLLGYTVLRTANNRRIVMPNSVIANQVTVNLSALDPKVSVLVPVSIVQVADIDRARALLLELAAAHPEAVEPYSCPLTALGPGSVDLSLQVHCVDAARTAMVKSELLEAAAGKLPAAGVEMPVSVGATATAAASAPVARAPTPSGPGNRA